jgi:hypothetical protein
MAKVSPLKLENSAFTNPKENPHSSETANK